MTLPLRSLVFWLHVATGLAAGTVVFVMAATGALLTYERQIVDRADASVRRVEAPAGTRILPLEALVARVRAARPDVVPTGLTITADPRTAVALTLGREGVLYANPFTGAPTGEGSRSARKFFRAVTEFHRFLGADGDSRRIGRAVTGSANLAFFVLVVSGLYLWVPRTFTAKRLRAVSWFRRGLSGKARDFNWHHTIGLWIALPLLVIVGSGAVMSFDWANDLVYFLAGDAAPGDPPRPGPPGGSAAGRGGTQPAPAFDASSVAGLDPLLASARERVTGWRTITIRLPKPEDESISFSIARSHRGRPDLRDTLELDRATGAVARWQPFAAQGAGRRARSWLRFLHTGEAGGVFGQSLAGLASAGTLVMVWTGIALAWRRFLSWRRSPSSAPRARSLEPAPFPQGDL